MTDLKSETHDFLRGYHRAMLDVAEQCLKETKAADSVHKATPPVGFFGRPSAEHYVAIGRGRASFAISTFCTVAANAAFTARGNRP